MIDLTLLGCGGSMPMPNRFLSSLLIAYNGRKILVDCGEGTQVSMKIANTGFKTIDVICITHIHGDHIIGLPGLLGTIGNSGRVEPLTIIGPEGIKEAVDGLMVIAKYLPYEVKVIEAPKEEITIMDGLIAINTLEVDHSSPCIAFSFYFKRNPRFCVEKAMNNNVPKTLWNRLQKTKDEIEFEGKLYNRKMVLGEEREGIKVSFVSDSRPMPEIEKFVCGSNVFFCEGTYGDDLDIEKAIKNKHMTFRESAALAAAGHVKKLILTHFGTALMNPEDYLHNATSIFKDTILGSDRLYLNLNFNN